MPNNESAHILPVAPLSLAVMDSCREFGEKVDRRIAEIRSLSRFTASQDFSALSFRGYLRDSYLLPLRTPRFGTGESKGQLMESVRGADLYIISDVTNHSMTYTVCGMQNHYSPDDHFQDMKRIIGAARTAERITVIMPFLYESRQHKRSKRESLDCAMNLEELCNMGIHNIITFDAHDPRVQNAIPLKGFDNFMPTLQFLEALFSHVKDLAIDKDHLMIISPDEGAMGRSIYFANNLSVDMGMFYKRRDYSTVVNGRNPIVAHEFLGASVKGKTVIIVDDMIASGESMLDTARELKERGAERVIVCCTFGLFTEGLQKFDDFHAKGWLDYVITTNLNYRPAEIFTKPWYIEADLSGLTGDIIHQLNHDSTISHILNPTAKIQELIRRYMASEEL